MTAITALIGGQDLGQEIYRALPTSDAGRGVMAGLGGSQRLTRFIEALAVAKER